METTTKGAGGRDEPTNIRDRQIFSNLTREQQATVAAQSALLYDGSRTVAACWKQALELVK